MELSRWARSRTGAAALLLFLSLPATTGSLEGGAGMATPDEHGPVTAIAIDAEGNGWFATGVLSGSDRGYLNLMGLVNGRPPWLTHGDPANRHRLITRMAITAHGEDGWAIGVEDEHGAPLLWRLLGTWRAAPQSWPTAEVHSKALAPTVELTDVALAADGHDGWLVGRDRKSNKGMLMRMRNGKWTPVAAPSGGMLVRVAISADGGAGWGFGYSRNAGGSVLFRLQGGRWSAIPGNLVPKGHAGKLITADDVGNGWIVTGPPGRRNGADTLIRLTRDGRARVVPVSAPPTGLSPEPPLILPALDVNGKGDGWAVGSLLLESVKRDGGFMANSYQVVPVRLRGDAASTVPPDAAGLVPYSLYNHPHNIYPMELAIGPDGAQALLGGVHGVDPYSSGNGFLYHLHEPWLHRFPEPAQAMPGAGRCFDGKPYCLRGGFFRFWEMHGGAERFGYPITPEVREELHFRDGSAFKTETFTVQYTERARFECPYACSDAGHVTLGRLGWDLANAARGSLNTTPHTDPFQPAKDKDRPGWHWFPQTQHNVSQPFMAFWQRNGGAVTLGWPISEELNEPGMDGKVRRVQYFERSRLEYHWERRGTAHEVTASEAGIEVFRGKYGYSP